MASLIAIVGSIGLTGTLSMNVLERTREIGIMRSIGANNRTLRNLVMVEGVLIGMISWFLGTLLGFSHQHPDVKCNQLRIVWRYRRLYFYHPRHFHLAGGGAHLIRPGERSARP